MWVLLFLIFAEPYHVDRIEVLKIFTSHRDCVSEINRIKEAQPHETTLACIPIKNAKSIGKTFSGARRLSGHI